MAYNKKGYAQRAIKIQELTARHYEPERQDRCYRAVWRRYIQVEFGICYDTYLKYLGYEVPPPPKLEDRRQLRLPFDE